MEDEVIPDSAITASTEFDVAHQARNGRLHFQGGGGRLGSWSANISDNLQWLQINFGNWTKVAGLAIQGKHLTDQWVESFSISFSYDGVLFKDYSEGSNKTVIVLDIFLLTYHLNRE